MIISGLAQLHSKMGNMLYDEFYKNETNVLQEILKLEKLQI